MKSMLSRPYAEVRARSLPNMRLEPLLGNKQKYKLNTASLMDLKSITAVQMRQYRRRFLAPINPPGGVEPEMATRSDEQTDQQQTVEQTEENEEYVKDEATDSDLETDLAEQRTSDDAISVQVTKGHMSDSDIGALVREKELSPLNLPKPKYRVLGNPRRTKRMKFQKSKLESIEEQDDIEKLSRSGSYNRLPLPKMLNQKQDNDIYFPSLEDTDHRKRDVAMLKQVNYGSKSNRQTSQMSIQALARKKLRRIPPIQGDSNTEDH